MAVTNREAEQWNKVAKAAAERRLRLAREEAVRQALSRPPEPLSLTGYAPRDTGLGEFRQWRLF